MQRFVPILLLFFCYSCQKDNTNEQINTGPLLKTYAELSGPPVDTLVRISYTYDNRNRVSIKVKQTYVFLLMPSIFIDRLDSTFFYYNGNQELPYQVKDRYYDLNLDYITDRNTYYTYDASGFLINDSSYVEFNSEFEKKVSKYRYSGNFIFTENNNNISGTISKDSIITKLVLCGANSCEQIDTAFYYTSTPSLESSYRKIEYTFDNDVNPFYAAKMRFPTWNRSDQNSNIKYLYEEFGYQKNNILEIEYIAGSHFFGGTHYTMSYQYTKNSDNTPATVHAIFHDIIVQRYDFFNGGYSY
ncbi:MAG: hypothetical protein ABI741_14115 [Ferruginibacter sp.]